MKLKYQQKRFSKERLQRIVDRFNRDFPVGTEVVLRTDSSGEITTTVTHPAIVLQGHSAVAGFAAVRGCYSIEDDRVRDAKALIPVADQR